MLKQDSLLYNETARAERPVRTSPLRRKKQRNYIEKIFKISEPYLRRVVADGFLTEGDLCKLQEQSHKLADADVHETVERFNAAYHALVKKRFQSHYKNAHAGFHKFLNTDKHSVKVVWGNCLKVMRAMKTESVHLMVTSPPYYNARAYSQWPTLDHYLADMEEIIAESYRVIDNHRAFVFNVGDITGNDHRHTKSSWGARRIPLGAYFINIFEKVGFKFIDDFVWDKGQVESQRHKNGDTPHPLYQYPMNCYEHIMVFYKHRADETRYPCPVCGCLQVNGNAYSGVGIRSWECKNTKCFERSAANRGKRFSARSVLMDALKTNVIDPEFVKKWRRDIVKINPTIKINSKGENTLGHTAPFPKEIPEFAIEMLTGKNEIVVDPFAGSFTSAIQAVKMGRVGVGFELNRKDFKTAIVNNIAKHGLSHAEFPPANAKRR